MKAIQEYYPDKVNECYGCGMLNEHGLQIKSYWDGNECICTFLPENYHKAFEGFVYGGLIASIIDCHSIATALAAFYKEEGMELGTNPEFGFVTASLKVDYLRPVPNGKPLVLHTRMNEFTGGNKMLIVTTLTVDDVRCVKGEVIAIKVPLSILE